MAEPLLEDYIPTSRTQDAMTYDDGTIERRCYQLDSPVYYKTVNDTYHRIEYNYLDNSDSNVGNILLRERNVISVGIRTDGVSYKYVGLRPDETQALGTQQLEFSLETVSLDGVEEVPNLVSPTIVDADTIDLGDAIIINKINYTRQAAKLNENTDCLVKYEIHLTGVKIANEQSEETYTVRDQLPSPSIADIGQITGGLNDAWDNYLTNASDSTNFSIGLSMRNGDRISKGRDDDLNDPLPPQYTVVPTLEDSCFSFIEDGMFHFSIKNQPTGLNLTKLLQETVAQVTGEDVELIDEYLKIDGKAICGFILKQTEFYGAIYCKDNSSKFSEVYNTDESWSTDKVSYIDVSYATLRNAFLTNIVNRFNIETEITVENAYIPDEYGNFTITDMDDNFLFTIQPPIAIDSEYNNIPEITTSHALYEIDGKYEYIKVPDSRTVVSKWLNDASYFDASTYYATSSSNTVGTGDVAAWATARAMTSGPLLGTGNLIGAGASYLKNYNISRTHSFFNTSGIPDADNITAAVFYFYIDGVNSFSLSVDANNRLMLFRSLNAGTSVASGHYNLAYFSTFLGQSAVIASSATGWFSITLSNLSYISKTGYTKIAIRHYRDYYNQTPTGLNTVTFNKSPAAGPAYLSVTHLASNKTVTFNNADPTMGGLSGTTVQSVAIGGNTTAVTAIPKGSCFFDGWTGSVTSSNNPLTITNVQADMTLTAHFKKLEVINLLS